MAYTNPVMAELMVPRSPEVAQRICGFFETIGWEVRNNSKSEFDTYVAPDVGAFPTPTIAYWQTENETKQSRFENHAQPSPSEYARGLRLPQLADLVEICLIVPSDDAVHNIFTRGGKLLENHTHTLPREHAGRQEFRFADPFNYSLRITANPGYEVNLSSNPWVGRTIDHCGGTAYEIDDVILRAQGWERTGELKPEALYTQIVSGEYPAGTRYSRSVEEIEHGTTEIEGKTVPIFIFEE